MNIVLEDPRCRFIPVLATFTLHHKVIRVVRHLTFAVPLKASPTYQSKPSSKISK